MFENELFDNYDFEEIPLDRDIYIIDEVYLEEYEHSMLELFNGGRDYEPVGFVCFVAARKISKNSVELSWYTNVFDRFHEIKIILPREHFIVCVGCWQWDEKPHVFVKSEWLDNLLTRSYSVFSLIDAIGVKKALENGELSREKLVELRSNIDSLAGKYPDVSFISFADSILLKSNWSVGYLKKISNIVMYQRLLFI